MAVNMAVNLGGLAMKNPVTTGSGTFGSGMQFADFLDVSELGAVTTKGVSSVPWAGGPMPRLAETPSGMLNAIGLQNPGVDVFLAKDLPWLEEQGATVIVNVCGHSIPEYVECLEKLGASDVPDAFEINLSCPNVDAGGMAIGTDPAMVEQAVKACRAMTDKPLIIKLTPNVTDITSIAKAAEVAGANAVSLINTLLGMAVDIHSRRPLLARVTGGLSGPAIKPVALAKVWQTSKAVSIPILGMGGISTGEDAVEFMLAGATAVSVGTANFVNPRATIDVINGIRDYCESQGVEDVNELIGALEC